MKKIIALFIATALIATFGVGAITGIDAIAGVTTDEFQAAVVQEQTDLLLEKVDVELSLGNDDEAAAYQEMADNNFGRTKLGFHKLLAAITTPSGPNNSVKPKPIYVDK